MKSIFYSLAFVAIASSSLSTGTALAQESGTTTRILVPFGAGTSTDSVGRLFAEVMGRQLKQTIVVENRAGAGGSIGSSLVAKASPDGKTLLMGTVGTHAINASLYKKLAYDAQKDFVTIAFAGYTPLLAVVPVGSSAKTVKDLEALAARPQGLSFASAGNGTSGHLAGELLSTLLPGKFVHVPYKEGAQALTDVISGTVDLMFYHPTAVLPHINSGKLRAVGVSSRARSAAAPTVATFIEQGYADFELIAWFMLYAPSSTPAAVVDQLRKAAQAGLAEPAMVGRLNAQGIEMRGFTEEQLLAFQREEISKWARLVQRSGAQVD